MSAVTTVVLPVDTVPGSTVTSWTVRGITHSVIVPPDAEVADEHGGLPARYVTSLDEEAVASGHWYGDRMTLACGPLLIVLRPGEHVPIEPRSVFPLDDEPEAEEELEDQEEEAS